MGTSYQNLWGTFKTVIRKLKAMNTFINKNKRIQIYTLNSKHKRLAKEQSKPKENTRRKINIKAENNQRRKTDQLL